MFRSIKNVNIAIFVIHVQKIAGKIITAIQSTQVTKYTHIQTYIHIMIIIVMYSPDSQLSKLSRTTHTDQLVVIRWWYVFL